MIKKVSFRNFKALRNVDVELERLTVIVGPNASGKTSILEGIHLLSKLGRVHPGKIFAGPTNANLLYSRGGKGAMVLLEVNTNGVVRIQVEPPTPFPDDILHSSDDSRWPISISRQTDHNPEGDWSEFTGTSELLRATQPTAFLRLEPSKLAAPSYVPSTRPQVQSDGEGLATALAYVASNRPDEFKELQESLWKVIPSFRKIRFDRVKVYRWEPDSLGRQPEPNVGLQQKREYVGEALIMDFAGASDIPGHMVSEGTMLVLAILAVLRSPERPKVVLLDDLERALHPQAQKELVDLLRATLKQDPDLQIIATSHSPYLLDCLTPSEVRLTALRPDGSVACAKLNEHPEFNRWKDAMTPGEFWSFVGEQWVGERAPQG